MPGVFAAELPSLLVHPLQHVAVADRGALERDTRAGQCLLEAEVAHLRADDATGQGAARAVIHRNHVEELVAVVAGDLRGRP